MAFFRWAQDVFPPHREVVNRILIVADGILDFCDKSEFGLSELCKVLRETPKKPWDKIELTTAHRAKDPCKCADIRDFTFDNSSGTSKDKPFSIENYDQVWLFGDLDGRGKSILPAEVVKIIEFMNAGGGMFATGDHRDLGVALCGEIPRVRSMRMWRSPPAPERDGLKRLDTLRQGTEKSFQSTDQSDGTPQEIRPRFTADSDGKKISFAHPLLRRGNFAVTILPDHMHEGECKVPTIEELNATHLIGGEFKQDYPLSDDGNRVEPEVVAISTSAGGLVVNESDVKPTEPRAFNIIVAYDGHRVRSSPIGRVAVDASFHHFVNINLIGTGEPGHTGFLDADGKPTENYEQIKQYFRNTASWLKPPDLQKRYYLNVLVALRYLSPLIEEVNRDSPYTEREILFVGTSTRSAIERHLSSVDSVLCSMAVTETLDEPTRSTVRELIDPWRDQSPGKLKEAKPAIDQELFVKFILGSAMIGIARNLPDDPCEAGREMDKFEKFGLSSETFAKAGLLEGAAVLTQILTRTSKTLNVAMFGLKTRGDGSVVNDVATIEGEETMATKCAKKWKSTRNGSDDGHVKVKDDGKEGRHEEKDLHVTVGCFDDGMEWDMVDGSTHLHYEGDFDGEDFDLPHEDHITGICIPTVRGRNRKDKEKRDDEVWVGVKTT